jgi:hypothetical protein
LPSFHPCKSLIHIVLVLLLHHLCSAWRARLAFRGKKTASEVIKCREEKKKVGVLDCIVNASWKKKHNYIFTPLNKFINQKKTNNMNFPCQIHQQCNSLTPSLNINVFNKMIVKQWKLKHIHLSKWKNNNHYIGQYIDFASLLF